MGNSYCTSYDSWQLGRFIGPYVIWLTCTSHSGGSVLHLVLILPAVEVSLGSFGLSLSFQT